MIYIDKNVYLSNSFFHGTQSLGTFHMTRLTRKNCLYCYKFERFEFNRWQHLMATPVFRQPGQTLAPGMNR